MFRALSVAAVLALSAGTPLHAAAPPPVEAYAAPSAFKHIALSPSGKKIALVTEQASREVIEVFDADNLKAGPRARYTLGAAPLVETLYWKNDAVLLFSVALGDKSLHQVVEQTRLMAVDDGLTSFANLGVAPTGGGVGPGQTPNIQDDVASWLPDDPGHVLVAIDWREPEYPSLRKVDILTGASETAMEHVAGVTDWITDPNGKPRIAVGDLSKSFPEYSLVEPDGKLTPLTIPEADKGAFRVEGFDRTPDRMVVVSGKDGGPAGLYVYDLSKRAFTETLFKDPRFDVGGAVMSFDGKSVVGVWYEADAAEVRYFDPAWAAKADAAARLVGADKVALLAGTPDASRVLVASLDDARMTEVWWVDLKAREARSLGRYRPSLDAAPHAKTVPVSFKARDGLEIPGYVVLPVGVASLSELKAAPFVVMPHGGPHARAGADFDWETQFLASRGYAVFEPNFRGSTGYGEAFEKAGVRQWGEAIQDDVADGARFVVAQGWADPNRMCVVGASFGGYTALVASYRNADLFKCAVDLAGPSDLELMIRNDSLYYGGDAASRALIGRAFRDADRLHRDSPTNNVASVGIPVLIVHGTADWTVPVEHSREMARRLKEAKKDVRYVELDLGDHQMSREKDRLAYLKALEAFLSAHLGPAR